MLFLLLTTLLIAGYFIYDSMDKWIAPETTMSRKWKTLLAQEVRFYRSLDIDKKHLFESMTLTACSSRRVPSYRFLLFPNGNIITLTRCYFIPPLLMMILKPKAKTVTYSAWSVRAIWKAK